MNTKLRTEDLLARQDIKKIFFLPIIYRVHSTIKITEPTSGRTFKVLIPF
jgi:hypothetical protein